MITGANSPFQAIALMFAAVSAARCQFVWATELCVNVMYRASEDASDGMRIERLLVRAL